MLRFAALLVLIVAACRGGGGSDPRCVEARQLYIAHQVEAVDRAVAAMPSPEQRNRVASRAREEIGIAESQFVAACEEMDGGELLACLRTPETMRSAECEPVAAELRRRMAN